MIANLLTTTNMKQSINRLTSSFPRKNGKLELHLHFLAVSIETKAGLINYLNADVICTMQLTCFPLVCHTL